MTIEEILQIGKVERNDENIAIIERFKEQISAWLKSDKFQQIAEGGGSSTYAALPYPPLLDPASINYETSDIKLCWCLNLPLPPFYDFMIFGSHAVSLHSGVPAFLKLCNCGTAGRQGEKESFRIYEQFFTQLKAQKAAKDKGKIKKIALIVSDLALDSQNDKLYSLMPARHAINIVRDPISNIKGLCNLALQRCTNDEADFSELDTSDEIIARTKRRAIKQLCFSLNDEPSKTLSELVWYVSGHDGEQVTHELAPTPAAVEYWMREIYQAFHDGIFARMLVRLDEIHTLQTKDFLGQNALNTMRTLAAKFGFDEPKSEQEWLFKERVSDYKYFLPAPIMLNPSALNAKNGKAVMADEKDIMVIWLTSVFKSDEARKDITKHFDLPEFFRVETDPSTAYNLLTSHMASKVKLYIKDLAAAIIEQSKKERAKFISEADVLEYFRGHEDSAEMFDGLLFQHLRRLRESEPKVLESFGFYKEFCQILGTQRQKRGDDGSRYRLVRKGDDKSYAFAKFIKEQLEKMK